MNLQWVVTQTKPDGLEEEEELKLRRVLLIMLHFNVKHSPVYIGVCIQQPKTWVAGKQLNMQPLSMHGCMQPENVYANLVEANLDCPRVGTWKIL